MGSRYENSEPPGQAGCESSPEAILVGAVVRAQALAGEVRIQIYSDVADRFERGSELLLTLGDKPPRKVRVVSFRPIRGGGIIRFEGCEDRDQAEALRGARLEVWSTDVPPAPEGLYYHFELLGCRCIDATQGDLGKVTDVVENGGGLILETSHSGRTLSIPFVESFLEAVDIEGQEIRFELPPGLVETCVSKS